MGAINISAVLTANKHINKARVTGKLTMAPTARINLLEYYMRFALEQIGLGKEEFKDIYQKLSQSYFNYTFDCSEVLCSTNSDSYAFIGTITNPYNPTPPSIVIPEPEDNQPPTIDDNTITVENGVTTILTLAMFTTDARYSDPEGDLLDAIRIDKIYSNNLGLFYVDGILLSEGQIITREQLDTGVFTHEGANVTTIQKDGFEFSVRDEGSQIWIN